MRIPGYCSECRRVRQVSVSGSGWRSGAVQTGICSTCEDAARFRPGQDVEERAGRHGSPPRLGKVDSSSGSYVVVRWEGERGVASVSPDRLMARRRSTVNPHPEGGR